MASGKWYVIIPGKFAVSAVRLLERNNITWCGEPESVREYTINAYIDKINNALYIAVYNNRAFYFYESDTDFTEFVNVGYNKLLKMFVDKEK